MEPSNDVRNKLAKFLSCELDCNSGQLNVNGIHQKLEPMVHQFLLLLIQHQGNIVTKQMVIETLWPNKKPTDEALRALIKKAREALKDNARKPSYIKTIPTKGYLLIPVVILKSTVKQLRLLQGTKFILWLGLAVVVLGFLLVWYLLPKSEAHKSTKEDVLIKTKVGIVDSSNVSTYFVNKVLKNVWVDDRSVDGKSLLIVADVTSKFEQKIAFTSALNKQLWFSQASQRFLVMRNDRSGFYSIQYSRQSREPRIVEYNLPLPSETTIRALDQNGKHIFVVSSVTNFLSLLDLDSGKEVSKSAIDDIHTEIQNAYSEFFENKTTNVSITIWPSPASSGFVVGLDFIYKTRLLYYPSVEASKSTSTVDIDGGLRSAVWNNVGQRFSFTNDQSNLFAFQIDVGKVTSFNANGLSINKVVSDCGSNCFVIANTQGIPKLSEFTNPFPSKVQTDNSIKVDNSYAQIIETNSITRNEYLGQYTNAGLYFVSQKMGKTEIIFRDNKKQENVVHKFEKQAIVQELTIDKNEDYLAGIVNKRAFVLNMNTHKLEYLPLTYPHVSHITFNANNMIQFYAEITASTRPNTASSSANSEHKSSINARQPNGLYQFNLDTKHISLLVANIKARRSLELVDITDKGTIRYKADIRLNETGEITVTFQNNRQAIVIDLASDDCANCWHVRDNYLYQINPSNNEEVPSLMSRINLLTGERMEHTLLFTDLLHTFSIHPSANKVMVTTRQNLQTELIKIEGFAQVF